MYKRQNEYRSASGAPGKAYYQQRADYVIQATLDDAAQRITGRETVTYTNQSPDELQYLWLQLDQNLFKDDAIGRTTQLGGVNPQGMSAMQLTNLAGIKKKEYGYNITAVKDTKGNTLRTTINHTMMRIDLPTPLRTGQSYSFSVEWNYNITEYYGRSGYEFFQKDDNYNYFIAHWFPRMCVYDDVNGWQHKQFLGLSLIHI